MIVGAIRSIRVLSVTLPPTTGTLRSTRTSTRLFLISASSRVANALMLASPRRRHQQYQSWQSYSITSLATASTFCGMVRPSALAVFVDDKINFGCLLDLALAPCGAAIRDRYLIQQIGGKNSLSPAIPIAGTGPYRNLPNCRCSALIQRIVPLVERITTVSVSITS